jgi:type VI secretion system protein ImpL
MSDDRDEVTNYGNGIRIKIDEIVRELGIQFPVYVLVTKCDLIEGFTDFFGRLPKKRLDELLGWTNPSWEKGESRQLVKGAMDEFRARVLAMRTGFLHEEERLEALRKIYLLPGELEAFEENLVEFCDVLFRETQFNEAAFLRGIYLTSGMQTGSAVSRMLTRLGLPAQATSLPEERKSYFLKDFFKARLPADRKLVAMTGRAGGRLQIVHNLGLVAAVLVFALASVITAGSYVANRTLLNNLETEITLARDPQQDPPARVTALARYAGALERLQYRNERRPWYTGLGLDTGDRAFVPARDLFVRQFGTYDYVPPVEGARRAVRERDADRSFPGLDALITDYQLSRKYAGRSPTTSEGDAPERLDALLLFWAGGQLPPEEIQHAYGRTYVDYVRWRDLATSNAEQERDAVLIREALPDLMTVDRVAAWADRFYKPVRAEDAGLPPTLANGATVRGAFTLAALGERVKPLTDSVADVDPELIRRFRREYVERYFREWRDFLMRPKDAAEGVVPVDVLLGPQTPYLALIDRTAAETAIGVSQPPGWARAVARVHEQRDAYVGLLQGIYKELMAARAMPTAGLDAAKSIFRAPVLAVPDGDAPPPADSFGKAERWATTTTGAGAPVDADEVEMRARLSTLLRVPVYAAFGAYLQVAHGEINRQWSFTVAGTTGIDPVVLWQKPGGTIWQFHASHLDPFLDGVTYLPKTRYTKSLPVRSGLAGALKTGEKIAGKCTPGRKYKLVFDSLPTTDPPGGALRVTRTVLNIFCGEGAPWSLEHRQYHRSEQLLWAPDACSRVELQVYVGSPNSAMGDERLLDSKVYNSLLDFIYDGQQAGAVRSWNVGGQTTVRFQVTIPPEIALCTKGGLPAAL